MNLVDVNNSGEGKRQESITQPWQNALNYFHDERYQNLLQNDLVSAKRKKQASK